MDVEAELKKFMTLRKKKLKAIKRIWKLNKWLQCKMQVLPKNLLIITHNSESNLYSTYHNIGDGWVYYELKVSGYFADKHLDCL